MITSKLFTINVRDILHGLLVASAAAISPVIGQAIESGNFTFNFTDIWHAAVAGAWGYIVVRFLTPAKQVKPIE